MAAPYDVVETVLNMARVALNDAIGAGLAGQVLTDAQPFTIQVINNAWRKLQIECAKLGFSRNVNTTLLQVPSQASLDAGTPAYINWSGYFDGSTLHPSPALPADFILPLSLQERQTGSGTVFYTLDKVAYPLPYVGPKIWNNIWTWFQETLYLLGTVGNQDLQIQYASFLPDFVANTVKAFTLQTIPIVRCATAFSLFVAAEVARPRGGDAADKLEAGAQSAVLVMAGLENPSLFTPQVAQ